MSIKAHTVISQSPESYGAGHHAAKELVEHMDGPPNAVLAYLTVNHDRSAFLTGLRDGVGPDTDILGCSVQGVMGRGFASERGYCAGVIGLGGGFDASVGRVDEIAAATAAKGRELGESLTHDRAAAPKAVVLLYDPLTGADMDVFLTALMDVVGCPIIGGGAGHFYGPMTTTFQFYQEDVTVSSAVAMALYGDFEIETAISTGCAPVGIEMTVTRADGPMLLELDGSPALEVWKDVAGSGNPDVDHTAALALGVPFDGAGHADEYLVRAAFGSDSDLGGVVLQAAIAPDTPVMLHHRTIDDVLGGTDRMANDLAARLEGRTVRAVLGFECGARTEPFLGTGPALEENLALQQVVAPDAAWLGMFAWGEVYTYGATPTFNNYTFPMLVVTE